LRQISLLDIAKKCFCDISFRFNIANFSLYRRLHEIFWPWLLISGDRINSRALEISRNSDSNFNQAKFFRFITWLLLSINASPENILFLPKIPVDTNLDYFIPQMSSGGKMELYFAGLDFFWTTWGSRLHLQKY